MTNKEKWRNSKAKAMLKEAIHNETVVATMKPKEVYLMEEEYQKFKYENFRTNLNTMRKAHKAGTLGKVKAVKWGKSEAKKLLRTDIVSGVVTVDMDARDVYESRSEYKDYKFENFKTNLANLISLVKKNQVRMREDCVAYGRDRALLNQLHAVNPPSYPPYPAWHKSDAKQLLKKDVDSGLHLEMDAIELFGSRDEYQIFPLSVFRKHIYQEVDERASKAHRFAKKKHRPVRPKETELLGAALQGLRERLGN